MPVDDFVCGDAIGSRYLEEFLQYGALDVRDEQIAQTVVAMYEGGVVGYVTYGINGLALSLADANMVGVALRDENTPAVRIYQLAVAHEFQRRGIGSLLMEHVLQVVARLREILPCPMMIVVSYDDALGFYSRFGFVRASEVLQPNVQDQCTLLIAALKPEI